MSSWLLPWRKALASPAVAPVGPGNPHGVGPCCPEALSPPIVTTKRHRYSIAKFQALDACGPKTNSWRAVAVLLVVPLPGLFTSIVPCFFPLQDISKGPNVALVLHLACAVASSTFGLMLTWLEVTRVPRSTYSLPQLSAVCGLATVIHCACFAVIVYNVIFPLPFAWVSCTPPLLLALVVAHIMVFNTRIRHDTTLRAAARAYAPSMVIQVSQVLFYPVFTVLYQRASPHWQLALILVFPLIKYAIKTLLKKVSYQLRDFSTEVSVCGVEIAASIYQTMIMQISPTYTAMICIIGLDVFHGLIVVKFFLDKSADPFLIATSQARASEGSSTAVAGTVTRRELIPLARELLQEAAMGRPAPGGAEILVKGEPTEIRDVMATEERTQMLRIALETLHLAEEILLTQYVEVVVPVVSCVFIAVASQLPSARFNPRIAMYHENPMATPPTSSAAHSPSQLLSSAVQSILVYSILQAGTLVLMQWVLWRRFGISAMSFLAFVLKHHALSIIGKLLAWLPVIFHFSVLQYGVDFTFTFESLKHHG